MIKKGSIIKVHSKSEIDIVIEIISNEVHTIAIVNKVDGDSLLCEISISSVNGEPYQDTKDIVPTYIGEDIDSSKLIDAEDFEVVLNNIDRKYIKDAP